MNENEKRLKNLLAKALDYIYESLGCDTGETIQALADIGFSAEDIWREVEWTDPLPYMANIFISPKYDQKWEKEDRIYIVDGDAFWMYINRDANSGCQFVKMHFTLNELYEAIALALENKLDLYPALCEMNCTTYCVDWDEENFDYYCDWWASDRKYILIRNGESFTERQWFDLYYQMRRSFDD